MSIRVGGLTGFNHHALKEAAEVPGGHIRLKELAITYAVFDASTPADALEQVQADMDHLRQMTASSGRSVRDTRYQALIAVRNKLRTAVATGHHHVRELEDPAPARDCLDCQGTGQRSWPQSRNTNPRNSLERERLAPQITKCGACDGSGVIR